MRVGIRVLFVAVCLAEVLCSTGCDSARGRGAVPRDSAAPVLAGSGSGSASGLNAGVGGQAGEARAYVGFDRNVYPGDARLAELHRQFAFSGYWLNVPPGEQRNSWTGRRKRLVEAGFGFLVLANGRLDAEIKRARQRPEELGRRDGAEAIAAAGREDFPAQTILFLDQEEGGRLLPEQAAYFFAWTETVAASHFRPGAYVSGQLSGDGVGADGKPLMITTAQDVREQIAARHLQPVVLWVSQDECPPAPGCTVAAPRLADSGTAGATVWQYAQSPRRPELTRSCAKTYGADGLCYAGVTTDVFLDLNVADSADPSHGR